MALKPWYKVVTPREDLREGRPLDASEFAVHLDEIKDGNAPIDYQEPERFFERTYLTKNLLELSSEVMRRLSGHKVETNAVFNMTTQLVAERRMLWLCYFISLTVEQRQITGRAFTPLLISSIENNS